MGAANQTKYVSRGTFGRLTVIIDVYAETPQKALEAIKQMNPDLVSWTWEIYTWNDYINNYKDLYAPREYLDYRNTIMTD